MLNYQYHRVLRKIAEETFPKATILPFKVEIHPKEMKTKHGDYNPKKNVIRIFNLSQKVDYTIATALHELAHHCELSLYGKTGHSKQFYEIFKVLLETAVCMGIVDYNTLRLQENANDIRMLEKHVGSVSVLAKSVVSDDEVVIKVLQSFAFRKELKEQGYFYDQVEKAWGKIVPTSKVETEKEFLHRFTSNEQLVVRSLYDLSFEAIYYVFIPNGFTARDLLKENGYFFKQRKKQKGWAKKIIATDLADEKTFLAHIGILEFDVVSTLV